MGDHIGSVVHGQVRLVGDGRFNMPVVGLVVFSLDGKGRDPFVPNQGGGDIVLSAQRVGGAEANICPAGLERFHQVGRFGGHV